ncbi:hypothetical protein PSN45_002365 [Yamadazyma tenuis]|uniref:NAD-dependent epimerase/dehydratase n=1 Tax=Candida tenuis (strain ATCC 10573 / BCRC 21748 / CBS 615 / JCM 9827 / NBRC 10315 / NRRL Y-1498 / VKM Y-70) TaxID=590646 RepID=G3B0R4_CANTC|nr:NAD-dependent epimerase/dehydratase [Yamadazyma tenuis ATCC 10573]EGV65456.1 NAD-dependent epimerase/dehydratase [Yamadazyma tenuis ATCC 10573]WEJ94865.1 hypothetical protein PSN45_002365 [Yamadazyma tenuis]
MKVFVTGATGFVGTAVVKELVAHGHKVTGLARSDESAEKLIAVGATYVKGELTDTDIVVDAAKTADGTVHLGLVYDAQNPKRREAVDRHIIGAICDAYIGTGKPFIATGGTLFVVNDTKVDEDFQQDFKKIQFAEGRASNELFALSYASKGVRSMSVRLSPSVHDIGDIGFIPTLIEMSKKNGYVYYPGTGENVWPAVHRQDAAVLYRLALEGAPAGSILHGVGEEGIPVKTIAEALSKKLGLTKCSVPAAELPEKLGPRFGVIFALNNPTSNAKTKTITGWKPTEIGLIEDILENY